MIVNIPVTCLERRNNGLETNQFMTIEDNIEIRVFNDNGKEKLPEKAHKTDARFDFKYPEQTLITI